MFAHDLYAYIDEAPDSNQEVFVVVNSIETGDEIASSHCVVAGISEYGELLIRISVEQEEAKILNVGTRRLRRDAVRKVIGRLSFIRDAEYLSLRKVPENFQNTENYENGEFAVETLDEVIEMLMDAY